MHAKNVTLIEMAVVLVAQSNNPSILNPDFLITNGIVNGGIEDVRQPAVSTPVFSQVRFKNGVAVTADSDRVVFSMSRPPGESILPPKIARSYLRQIPHAPYRAIGVNSKFFVRSADRAQGVSASLRNRGAWMSFKDVMPEVALKFTYTYNDRTINLEVADARLGEGDETLQGQMFQANVHRDLTESNTKSRNERINSILDAWKRDLDDVGLLIDRFCPEG